MTNDYVRTAVARATEAEQREYKADQREYKANLADAIALNAVIEIGHTFNNHGTLGIAEVALLDYVRRGIASYAGAKQHPEQAPQFVAGAAAALRINAMPEARYLDRQPAEEPVADQE